MDVVRVSVIPNASASTPSSTPANLALGGSGHADAINSYPTRAACFTDLRDHAVRLMKRRGRHGLHGCCQGQGKSNSDQSDHSFLQCEPLKTLPAQSRLFKRKSLSRDEKSREGAEHSDAKKRASAQFGLTGRRSAPFRARAGRRETPDRKSVV